MLNTHQQGFAKLIAMIDALEVGMLTTEDEQGILRSRPMATQRADDGVLWFFTSNQSAKVDEVHKDAMVNVSYADPNNQIYVSVSGYAKTMRDPAKVRELWNERAQRWFPKGPSDPTIALLAVDITKAEYWDLDTRSMTQLLEKGARAEEIMAATDHKKLS